MYSELSRLLCNLKVEGYHLLIDSLYIEIILTCEVASIFCEIWSVVFWPMMEGMFDYYIRARYLNDDVDFSCLYQQSSLADIDTRLVVDHRSCQVI